ncbi:hypothetical protein ACFLTQ_02370 [Chloroflexota bacterium]
MNQERIFTEEELEEMGTRTLDLIEHAIDLGNYEKAKELSRRMYKEYVDTQDSYVDWVAVLLSFIGRQYGDDVLYKAFEESIGQRVLLSLDIIEKADIRQRIEFVASNLRRHCQPMDIKEDEEKVVFKMKPCGTGGRQILAGKYEPPLNFLKVKKPQPMTFWKEDFPVYCCHAHFVASAPVAQGRTPPLLEIPSDKPGEEPCEIVVYKDPQSIPLEAYAKVGVEK